MIYNTKLLLLNEPISRMNMKGQIKIDIIKNEYKNNLILITNSIINIWLLYDNISFLTQKGFIYGNKNKFHHNYYILYLKIWKKWIN